MLLVGDRVVLRATAPPETEYALFELAEIELRASEPGRVREYGYQTTVEEGLSRLAGSGATASVARECALALTPLVAEAYARGHAARQVAKYLGPLEMFQTDLFDAASHAYHGVFLDLPLLANDLGLQGASAALQALYLVSLLGEERPDTTVFLQTEAWTKQRKPGERTHKRPALSAVKDLASAITDLARRGPQPEIAGVLPRADVVAFIRARSESAPDDDARALYAGLERAVSVRDMPDKGPLSEPELWAIETKLDTGVLDGVLDAVEAAERTRGRTPGTTYLRARASLMIRVEPPKLIAERVSALALSMTSFQELSLLAAEAWLEAGEPRRAMPYARDLVDAPLVEEGLLMRAQRLLARAVGAAPDKPFDRHKTYADSMPAAPMPPSVPPAPPRGTLAPPVNAPPPGGETRTFSPAKSRTPTARGNPERPATSPGFPAPPIPRKDADTISAPPPAPSAPPPPITVPPPQKQPSLPPVRSMPPRNPSHPPASSVPAPPARSMSAPPSPSPSLPPVSPPAARATERPQRASVQPGAGPPPLDLELTPPPMVGASFTVDMPPRAAAQGARSGSLAPGRNSLSPPTEETRPSRRPGRAALEERGPTSGRDPRVEPDSEDAEVSARAEVRDDGATPRNMPVRIPSEAMRPAVRKPDFDDEDVTIPRQQARSSAVDAAATPRGFMAGASLPPYKTEEPAPLLPRAPLLPKLGAEDELVEHLALPPGVATDVKLDVTPKSILEARVQFTLLARELGVDYRKKRGVTLRTDVSGIEAIQAVLLETFANHLVKTPDDARELRRHGALLSELLARRLDAEWIDISPAELGRWSMLVPPNTRVWPFGRVARLIQMGHKERDLVSYFFELQSRASKR
jgi:hypothetical protein